MKSNKNIIIVGGGLSGLTLAYILSKHNINSTILEGSERLGGRIQTLKGKLETPLELGATWFSDLHLNVLELLKELGLEKYPQFTRGKSLFQTSSIAPPQEFYIPASESPSYRIKDGTDSIINVLISKVSNQNIRLNTKVKSISEAGDRLILKTTDEKIFEADKVVLCLPPKLAYHSIQFSPQLPENVVALMPKVQTWMADTIKFVIEYKSPFWRANKLSGVFYSHTGIVIEMYDHTNYEEDKFGFTGFLNSSAATYSKNDRQELVLNQLSDFFGKEILNPVSYEDKIWSDGFISQSENNHLRSHQNNGHHLLNESYFQNKLYFSGTETSTEFGGYMEGAIISAKNVALKILQEAR